MVEQEKWVDYKRTIERFGMQLVLEKYRIKGKKSGKNPVSCCPIHHGPNSHQFSVNLEKSIWHCFGDCKIGGNILDFAAMMKFGNKELSFIRQAAPIKLKNWFNPEPYKKVCTDIVIDILANYEGFTKVENGPNFRGRLFDFFGFKDGEPHMIAFKGSLNSFNHPGETQKRRLLQVLDRITGLKAARIQVKVRDGKYRFYNNEQRAILFYGPKMPIKPIVDRM